MLVALIILVQQQKSSPTDSPVFSGNRSLLKHTTFDVKVEDKSYAKVMKDKSTHKNSIHNEEIKRKHIRHQMAFDEQKEDIKVCSIPSFPGDMFKKFMLIHLIISVIEANSVNYESWDAVYANEIQ